MAKPPPNNAGKILLAVMGAGLGRRFGAAKLEHIMADGRPLLEHTGASLAGIGNCYLCLRPEDSNLKTLAAKVFDGYLEVPDAELGLSRSIVTAAAKAEQDAAAALLIALGDMPFLSSEVVASLAAQAKGEGPFIIAPIHPSTGQLGHPVIFSAHFFAQLQTLQGDKGARAVIEANRHCLHTLPSDHPGCYWDVDCPADLTGPSAGAKTEKSYG
ncbi:MAG: NTP transferase domain-containing protein [Cellvibrionaceae bacterium]|nr:NTP transferase domain-containing protein [Cellvibrionaceae bacterium]